MRVDKETNWLKRLWGAMLGVWKKLCYIRLENLLVEISNSFHSGCSLTLSPSPHIPQMEDFNPYRGPGGKLREKNQGELKGARKLCVILRKCCFDDFINKKQRLSAKQKARREKFLHKILPPWLLCAHPLGFFFLFFLQHPYFFPFSTLSLVTKEDQGVFILIRGFAYVPLKNFVRKLFD